MKIAMAVVVLILAGCGNSPGQDVTDGMGSGRVTMVRLDDGTRCAVLVGYSKGAIDCDWQPK